jgi:uncharacterized phage protein (TIGR01671 family)
MDRDIKFRAWDKQLNVMWEPIALTKLLKYLFENMPNTTAYTEIKKHFDDVVWLQYTGLTDKNGKEIYEGDLLRLTGWYYKDDGRSEKQNFDIRCKVKYDNTVACFSLIHIDPPGSHLKFFDVLLVSHDKEFEVIGNIYETPDLLGEQK